MRIFLLALTLGLSCGAQDGLVYSRIFPSLGNVNDTAVTAMTSDAAGNIYLTGSTEEPSLPVTPGVVQPKFTGGGCTNGPNTTPFTCPDGFVVKLDANSNIVFATYLGGGYSTDHIHRSGCGGQHLCCRHNHRISHSSWIESTLAARHLL